MIQATFDFHPVGQGLFASGQVSSCSIPICHRWVYDCGSVSNEKSRISSITNFRNQAICCSCTSCIQNRTTNHVRPTIDLVTISHFHKDHVNGLKQLFDQFVIKRILIPLIPVEKRVLTALKHRYSEKSIEYINFLINPVEFLSDLISPSNQQNGEIDLEVIFVPGIDTEVQRENDTDFLNDQEDGDLLYETSNYQDLDRSTQTSGIRIKTTILKNGLLFHKKLHWIHILYNKQKHMSILSKQDVNEILNELEYVLAEKNSKKKYAHFEKIQNKYRERVPKRLHNDISLVMRSGPINSRIIPKMCIQNPSRKINLEAQDINMRRIFYRRLNDSMNSGIVPDAVLYTGDSVLKDCCDIIEMRNYFRRVLGTIRGPNHCRYSCPCDFYLANQVPHHGSKNNSSVSYFALVPSLVDLFCADPNYSHKHPNNAILRLSNNPFIVSSTESFSMTFWYHP